MDKYIIKTEEAFGVIFHSYRMKVIKTFSNMPEMTATFKQIADMLGDNSSKVTYHGKMLISLGILVLDHTEVINGINAKYYKLTTDTFELDSGFGLPDSYADLLKSHTHDIMSDFIKEMEEEVADAVKNEDSKGTSLNIYSSALYLTDEEITEMQETIQKFSELKTKREGTKKVDFYSLFIYSNDKKTEE